MFLEEGKKFLWVIAVWRIKWVSVVLVTIEVFDNDALSLVVILAKTFACTISKSLTSLSST